MIKILVIEDEEDIRANILEALEYEGFNAIGAANGRSGIASAKEHVPDLIICDISMPEMDGHTVISELRHDSLTAMIPFIFLTARTTNKDVRKGMNLGADDYLTKPFELDDLLAAIHTRLDKLATISDHFTQKIDELSLNLSYNLPHELRTPLTGIIGFAQLLTEFGVKMAKQEPEEIVQIGKNIFDSALRLHRLIENYLFYSELKLLEHQPEKLQKRQTNVCPVRTENLIASIASSRAEKCQRAEDLSLDLAPTEILISEANLQKMVTEILDNAFKFSRPGTPVDVVTKVEKEQCMLSITNQGRGMTKEQITGIGAYRQFDRNQYEQQGSGLGLTIARLLAQLHNAKLTIDSIPDQSITVRVVFAKHVGV